MRHRAVHTFPWGKESGRTLRGAREDIAGDEFKISERHHQKKSISKGWEEGGITALLLA